MTTPTREQVVQWADAVDWGLYSPVTYTKLTEFSILARAGLEATVKKQAAEIAELQRWRTSGIERSAKDSDIVSSYRQQLAAAQLHIEQLREAIRTFEWSAISFDNQGITYRYCPDCGNREKLGKHTIHCRRGKALSIQPDLSSLHELLNSKLEEAATVCEKSDRYRGDYFAEKIRALKE